MRNDGTPAGAWRWLAAALVALLVAPGVLAASDAQGYTLTIVADGVSTSKGVVGVLIFRSSAGWPEDSAAAFRAQSVPAKPGSTTVAVAGLPPGIYAVVVLHDENQNMRLDRNWMGIPKEQWGMSENPHVGMSAPHFSQAEFRLAGDMTIRVLLH